MGLGKEKKPAKKARHADAVRGKLIFFEALLTIYALITILFAFLFEFHTVYVSGGSIIFSFEMSWQVILFAVEFVTIVIQIISIAVILKRNSGKAAKAVCAAGYAAGAASVLCVLCLLCTQGFKVIPLVPFSVYAILICLVRMWLIPRTVKVK